MAARGAVAAAPELAEAASLKQAATIQTNKAAGKRRATHGVPVPTTTPSDSRRSSLRCSGSSPRSSWQQSGASSSASYEQDILPSSPTYLYVQATRVEESSNNVGAESLEEYLEL